MRRNHIFHESSHELKRNGYLPRLLEAAYATLYRIHQHGGHESFGYVGCGVGVSRRDFFHVPGRTLHGPDGYLSIIGMMRGGFRDITWSLEELIVEDDKGFARFILRGTHTGVFFGVQPTGKQINVQAMNLYRWSKGQIVEERGQPDMLTLLRQIGAVPEM